MQEQERGLQFHHSIGFHKGDLGTAEDASTFLFLKVDAHCGILKTLLKHRKSI
jgi:hypothetical protein